MTNTQSAMMDMISHGTGGPPSVLTLTQTAVPPPGPGEVRIRVAYAGVNRPDCLQRSGSYPPPAGASPILGLECSGEIVALGEQVTQWALGDRVCALCNGGAYAEEVCVPSGQVLPIPNGLSLLEAASLPENWFTVYHNVIERGQLRAGESILIHGGTSGIGLSAIQLARSRGATVHTTVGNEEKAEFVKRFSAMPILYKTEDFVEVIHGRTNRRGVDVILDMVAGDYIPRNLSCLAEDGRLVQIAFLQSPKVEVDFRALMIKRLTFTGSTLRPRTAQVKAQLAQSLLQHIWPLLAARKIVPVIHEVFPLAQAAAAHTLMESNQHIGKIMLKVAGD
jgi:NADPH:quinone reductase